MLRLPPFQRSLAAGDWFKLKGMFLSALAAFAIHAEGAPHSFAAVGDHFELDGKPFVVHSGEIHYPRVPEPYWRSRLRMAKAMGLNTVCTYVFWNLHEPKKGVWDFKGNLDIAKFCRIAQEEGLYVTLRPGPYICAEDDLGGFPAWLLRDRTMRIRSNDPKFIALTRDYLDHLGKQLKPLLVQNGGPIILTQVENEYGSYGSDHAYVANIRAALQSAGFSGQLFTADPPSSLPGGTLPGIPPTVNFGNGAESGIAALSRFRPGSPRMIGEFWAGWFDAWGKRHATSNLATNLRDIEWCLKNGVSFNLYMFHGGTNWGFMAGSNGGPNSQEVDTTSYDYDAALDESGRPTPKYAAFRDLIAKYTPGGLPQPSEIPAAVAVPPVRLTERRPLRSPIHFSDVVGQPRSFEDLDQAHGLVAYTSAEESKKEGKQTLSVGRVMDYAIVFIDGKRAGTMDRRLGLKSVEVTVRKGSTITILVEALSRVNYGGAIVDERKGLEGPVTLGDQPLDSWFHTQFPLDSPSMTNPGSIPEGEPTEGWPSMYRGTFRVPKIGDTFLDMRGWNKGFVWVNGHNLGRFWKIGPQQTLYVPGVWLKKGANEVVVYDEGPAVENPTVQGLAHPLLDSVNRPAVVLHHKPGQTIDLSGLTPVASGEWPDGPETQSAAFIAHGRYLALQILGDQTGNPYASLAELWAQGADGKSLDRKDWKVVYADSEETENENGGAENVLDLQPPTIWHTAYTGGAAPGPHLLVIDFGTLLDITSIRALPRGDNANGRIKGYRIYVSETPFKGN